MYMGCHSTLDRRFVRKVTPNTNTSKLFHLGMGMIWRHTPPPPYTALLTHGHNLRRVEGKEGASVPHRLHAVKELHYAKQVLNGADREHICDHPGRIHHSSKSSIKKDIPLPVAFKALTPSFQAATDWLPFETAGGPCVLNLFLWKLMPNPTFQNPWKNKWSVDTIGYVDTVGDQRQKGCPCAHRMVVVGGVPFFLKMMGMSAQSQTWDYLIATESTILVPIFLPRNLLKHHHATGI